MSREINLFLPIDRQKDSLRQKIWQWRKIAHVVGLEISAGSVRACYTERRKGEITRTETFEIPLPPETIVDGAMMNFYAVGEALKTLKQQLQEKQVPASARMVLAINGHCVIIKRISIPEMPQEDLDESIQWEAEQYIPFDIKDVNVDAQIVNPLDKGQMDVLLVAVKRNVLNDYVSVCHEAGIKLSVAEPGQISLKRFLISQHDPAVIKDALGLVHISENCISIAVTCNGMLCSTRDISMGTNLFVEEIMKALNVSWEEAQHYFSEGDSSSLAGSAIFREIQKVVERVSEVLTTEVQRFLDFFAATTINAEIARIFISGRGGMVSALLRSLERRLEVPTEQLICRSKFSEISPVFGLCAGLALREDFEIPRSAAAGQKLGKVSPLVKAAKKPKPYEPSKEELIQLFEILAFTARYGIISYETFIQMSCDPQIRGRRFRQALGSVNPEKFMRGISLSECLSDYVLIPPIFDHVFKRLPGNAGEYELFAACARYLRTGSFCIVGPSVSTDDDKTAKPVIRAGSR